MNALQVMSPQLNPINWEIIEGDWLPLPPLYKLFHDIYDIKTIRDLYLFLIEGKYGLRLFGDYEYKYRKSIVLDTIFKADELMTMQNRLMDLDDELDYELLQSKFIPIGYDSSGCLLMLGIGTENSDKIYYYNRHLEERLFFLSDNIFTFFKYYEIIIDEVYLHGVTLDRLYRNWGEDFWRVRE